MNKPKRERSPCVECGVRTHWHGPCKKGAECHDKKNYTIRRLLASNREMRKAIFTRECGMCPEHTPKACKGCSWWEFTKGIKASITPA